MGSHLSDGNCPYISVHLFLFIIQFKFYYFLQWYILLFNIDIIFLRATNGLGNIFLGATDVASEGVLLWLDGTGVDLNVACLGDDLDNVGNNQHYLYMVPRGVCCDSQDGPQWKFICEINQGDWVIFPIGLPV